VAGRLGAVKLISRNGERRKDVPRGGRGFLVLCGRLGETMAAMERDERRFRADKKIRHAHCATIHSRASTVAETAVNVASG